MYRELLISPDEKLNNVAKNFMSGSVEIKRILKEFTKTWCDRTKALHINDHARFLKDTDNLFELVLQRILDETERLYRWCVVSAARPLPRPRSVGTRRSRTRRDTTDPWLRACDVMPRCHGCTRPDPSFTMMWFERTAITGRLPLPTASCRPHPAKARTDPFPTFVRRLT